MTVIEAMGRIEKQPYYTDLLCESAREVVSVYKKMADYVPTGNLTLYAKFEAAVKYKVQILTEYYERTGIDQFSFPSTKEYRDSTSEFMNLLSLQYDAEGN